MTPFEYLDTWDALDLGQHCLSSWDWKILWQPWPLGTDAQKGSSTNHSKAQGGRRSCRKVKAVEGWHHGIYLWSGWTLGGGVLGRISNDLNAIWRYSTWIRHERWLGLVPFVPPLPVCALPWSWNQRFQKCTGCTGVQLPFSMFHACILPMDLTLVACVRRIKVSFGFAWIYGAFLWSFKKTLEDGCAALQTFESRLIKA